MTCCDVMQSNLSFKMACDSSLFLWDCVSRLKYYSRSFHLKSNRGFNLPSGICVSYTFLLFMTESGVAEGGFGHRLKIHPEDSVCYPKPHFLCLGCSQRLRVGLLIVKESSLVFIFFFFLNQNLLFLIILKFS